MRAIALTGFLAFALGGCFESPPEDDDASAGPTVTLSGIVNTATWPDVEPLSGVRVEVVGSSRFGITDAQGHFTIENVPADRVAYLAAKPSNSYVGTIQGLDVRYADIEGIELRQLSNLQIEQQMTALREMDPDVRFDAARGHLAIVCDTLAASATAEPLPSDALFYALDANGAPMLGDRTFRFFLMPLVVFANVDVSDAGVLQIGVDHPMQACTVEFASPPTLANHLTWVPARCN